ncbi:hypothetical protein LOAG_13716 [Loa loa]|uniref:Uncharacterized protein n=1 Tax=Loa loa TaxID=7209 RepID=A0A1S0TJI2_LOALO|nr:hypothetical protein LOAG_13716 [Loa loa]EFO14798.1 hypothetical protein LOAG_13716 [Loa loa]
MSSYTSLRVHTTILGCLLFVCLFCQRIPSGLIFRQSNSQTSIIHQIYPNGLCAKTTDKTSNGSKCLIFARQQTTIYVLLALLMFQGHTLYSATGIVTSTSKCPKLDFVS